MTIEELLVKIAELLDTHGVGDWAQSFRQLQYEYKCAPEPTKGKIRSVYGGMGSFNDVILHDRHGIPLRDENDELDQMRSKLFQLSR